MKKRLNPDEQTWVNMRASLLTYKARCASLERKVACLEADHPCIEHERTISELETRVTELLHCCELAELEVLQLRRIVEGKAA